MLLQVALDVTDMEHALAIVRATSAVVTLYEVGTPLLIANGMEAVRAVRSTAPEATIVADCKVMDGGGLYAEMVVRNGANGIIVQAAAPRDTLVACVSRARDLGAFAMVDSLGCLQARDLEKIPRDIGVTHVVLHVGKDEQASGLSADGALSDDLVEAASAVASLAIAGGLQIEDVHSIVKRMRPDVLIVGEAIWRSASPRVAVDAFLAEMTLTDDLSGDAA